MKIRFMQIVDYWIGVPLCGFFSAWRVIRNLLVRNQLQSTFNKVLIIELSEMGTTILGFPAIQKLTRMVQKANSNSGEVYFLTFARNREGIEVLNAFPKDNIFTINDSSLFSFLVSCWKTLFVLRRLKIDVVIDWELFSRFTALFSFLTGAHQRVGFDNYTAEGLYRGRLLTKRVYYNPYLHISQNLLNTVDSLYGDVNEEPILKKEAPRIEGKLPKHSPSVDSIERIKNLLPPGFENKRLILINPDPGIISIRGWPIKNYIDLIERILSDNENNLVVLTGIKSSKHLTDQIREAIKSEKIIDLVGRTKTLFDFLTLLNFGTILVTNDGGPAHFSAMTDIKCVVFFGPESPALYRPLDDRTICLYSSYSCSPCLSANNHRHTQCNNNRCLQAISVETTFDAVKGGLEC